MKKAFIVTLILIISLAFVPLVAGAFSDSTADPGAFTGLGDDPYPYPYPPAATPTPGIALPLIFR